MDPKLPNNGESNLQSKPKMSKFLQKQLDKGTKYFDSGDYNMNKARLSNQKNIETSPIAQSSLKPPAYNNVQAIKKKHDLPISRLATEEEEA